MYEEDEISDPADNDDDVHEEVKAPSSREVEHSLEAMKNYSISCLVKREDVKGWTLFLNLKI